MTIIVHDTHSSLRDVFREPLQDRAAALKDVLSPMQEAMTVMGGMDVVQFPHMGGGFRTDREDPRYLPALEQMRVADVWGQVENRLAAASERLLSAVPGIKHAETIHVVVMLGDPDDEHLTVRNSGYLGMGGIPGLIHLTMWPTETSLTKIGHTAAHELHHNVRYANVLWNPMTVTVGEHIVAEGLAEAFVRELAGDDAMGPWTKQLVGPELDRVYEKVTAGIDVAGMQYLTPYVHGDATARRMGQQPVGLPDFAGYAAGLRIVDAHLAASGLTAAQSTGLPAREILTNAGIATPA
ncbi:DUF2268 domain-containing protein [Streptomyces sp. WAC06614]|uniref:DUF2268 domain-containing protein n=1 Tax=Streptomyces sp. WAC06614 TaxID=2487416 RepID=UPI000F766D43|nr:DUF2268 domain-containing putative Zn-dependent protease [Streptomyces sp. WAC06614]RSS79579.1 peptidase [Streptomyces sp. WAC06614]